MYSKNVDRANPGCFIFLVDQSFSMTDGIMNAPNRPKIEAVATAINRIIAELISACERGEEKPRHYFDIGGIGYTTDKTGIPIITGLFSGALAGRDIVSIVDLYDNPLDIEIRQKDDGVGGLIDIRFPIWYRVPPHDQMAGTPMCNALERAYQVASEWCATHPNSFPPVVINLTDGESTDGNAEPFADKLRSLATQDGNLLLFNCHLSQQEATPVFLPSSEMELPDDYGRGLFRMASPLPDSMRLMAEVRNIPAPMGARCMAFNADSTNMIKLISVGTVVAEANNLR